MTRNSWLVGCVVTVAVLVLADSAISKEIRTTRVAQPLPPVPGGISSIAACPDAPPLHARA